MIICPVALMQQWKGEIDTKSDGRLKVLLHHGPSRTNGSLLSSPSSPSPSDTDVPSSPADGRKLQRYDVVITSYQTCSSEWVDPKPKKGKGKAAEGSDDGSDDLNSLATKKQTGALFDADYSFYRSAFPPFLPSLFLRGSFTDLSLLSVILDEAHQIKGRTTKMHKACCALEAHYRWCLSASPSSLSSLS